MTRGCRFLGLHILLALACQTIAAFPATASELRDFSPSSTAELLAGLPRRPMLMTFWSAHCVPCRGSLQRIAQLVHQAARPLPTIVVVNVDGRGDQPAILAELEHVGLADRTTWVFDDSAPERLRYSVDPHWSGELPRTYWFESGRRPVGVSGSIAPELLERWLAKVSAVAPPGTLQR